MRCKLLGAPPPLPRMTRLREEGAGYDLRAALPPWLLPQWCALALASLLLMAPAAHAQSSARLAGSVFDATGLPLASVHIRLRGSSDMVTKTDANGRFELPTTSPVRTLALLPRSVVDPVTLDKSVCNRLRR